MRSPYTPSVDFPGDYYAAVLYSGLFGVAHWALKKVLLVPTAKFALDHRDRRKQKAQKVAGSAPVPSGDSSSGKLNGSGTGNGHIASNGEKTADDKKDIDPAKIRRFEEGKFAQSMWNSLCHIWLCGLTLVAMWDEPWVYDTPTWFTEWPGIEMNDAMKFMYQWYIAYTIYSFLDIIFSTSARQKDFSQMMVHHSTTFFLCTFSFYFGFHRVGAVMMFIHDISDPPMEIAKLFLYTGYQQMADLTFVFFALVFAYTRIWLYPRHVLTAVWFYGPRTFPDGTRADWLFYIVCSALLALLALHVFWIWLIGVIIFKALRDGNVEGDVRDEMEDE